MSLGETVGQAWRRPERLQRQRVAAETVTEFGAGTGFGVVIIILDDDIDNRDEGQFYVGCNYTYIIVEFVECLVECWVVGDDVMCAVLL